MAKRISTSQREMLLKEYATCQSSVESLEASVWQSAAIIGLVSIGTFAVVVVNSPSVPAAFLVGGFSSIGTFTWWRLARRWWSVRDAKIARMRHIEEDFEVYGQSHYIGFMDDLHEDRTSQRVPSDDPLVSPLSRRHKIPIARARALATELEYERKGPKDALWFFPWATLFVWVAYGVFRIADLLWGFVSIKLILLPFWIW